MGPTSTRRASIARRPAPWGVISFVLAFVLLVAAVGHQSIGVAAQEPEESAEQATLALQPYKLLPEDLPPGYQVDSEQAYSNDAQAFENTYALPPDPRPAEFFLQQFTDVGRVARIRQAFVKAGDPDAVELRFNIVLFRSADGASRGVRDLSLLFYLAESDQVARMQPGLSLGDETVGHRLSFVEDDRQVLTDVIAWRRGRVAFAATVYGAPEAVEAARPALTGLAEKANARIAGLAPPSEMLGTAAAFLPASALRLELYKAFTDRLLPDDSLPGMESQGVDSIANPEIINDAPGNADPPAADLSFIHERLIDRERRILGLHKAWEPAEGAANPSGTRFPSVSLGYHVYADADGAIEAMNAPLPEIALRMHEAITLRRAVGLEEMAPPLSLGDQTRAFKGRSMFEDGLEVEVVSLRWRRGAVELFADVAMVVGSDPSERLRQVAGQHDAAYTAGPPLAW